MTVSTKKFLDDTGLAYFKTKLGTAQASAISTAISTALQGFAQGLVTIHQSLPASGEEGKLYLVPDANAGNNIFTVYTWEAENDVYAFKQMGTTTLSITVDSALSSSSENPVQNKVIKAALDDKYDASTLIPITTSEIDALF